MSTKSLPIFLIHVINIIIGKNNITKKSKKQIILKTVCPISFQKTMLIIVLRGDNWMHCAHSP